ncbi:hypothetical protein GCM10009678_91660 [Actinomadura kijaniata]
MNAAVASAVLDAPEGKGIGAGERDHAPPDAPCPGTTGGKTTVISWRGRDPSPEAGTHPPGGSAAWSVPA